MRHGRAKAARRTLQFCERTQAIRPPYHILLDGTFCVAVVQYKVPLLERLDRLLQHAAVVLSITASSLEELERLQTELTNVQKDKKSLLEQARQWAKENCQHILSKCDDLTDSELGIRSHNLSAAARDILNWSCGAALSKKHAQAPIEDIPDDTNKHN